MKKQKTLSEKIDSLEDRIERTYKLLLRSQSMVSKYERKLVSMEATQEKYMKKIRNTEA
jgi:predicted  nucleic acid-binding Zn-ribbon protein